MVKSMNLRGHSLDSFYQYNDLNSFQVAVPLREIHSKETHHPVASEEGLHLKPVLREHLFDFPIQYYEGIYLVILHFIVQFTI